MEKKIAIEKFLAGEPVIILEYRSSKCEQIEWRDKQSKEKMVGVFLRHNCESAAGVPFSVSERVTDKTLTPESYKAPFKRGTPVVLVYRSMITEKGHTSFNGSLEPLVG